MKEELPIMEEPDRDSCDMLCRYLAGGPCYVPRLSNHGPCGPGLPFSPWASGSQLFPLTRSSLAASLPQSTPHTTTGRTTIVPMTLGLKPTSPPPNGSPQTPALFLLRSHRWCPHVICILYLLPNNSHVTQWSFLTSVITSFIPTFVVWDGNPAVPKEPTDCPLCSWAVNLQQPHGYQMWTLLTPQGGWPELDRAYSGAHSQPQPMPTHQPQS